MLYGIPSPGLVSKSGWSPTFKPIALIIAAESLATGSESTRAFHWLLAGKISQLPRGGIATGFGVGLGVGFGVGRGVARGIGRWLGAGVGPPLARPFAGALAPGAVDAWAS